MKILITGTNGFVGKNLIDYFETRNEDIHCPKREHLNLLNSISLFDYLKNNKFDLIIHCGININSVEENLKMYFNLERCSRHFGKMFCIGSGAEYDMRNYTVKMKETYFKNNIPADIYGFSKYVIAKDIEFKKRNIYNLRVFGIFGKFEDYKRRFISNNICRVICNLDILMNKNMLFDYIYVNDFCKVIGNLLDKNPIHRSYNICANKSIDLLSLAKIIKTIDGDRAKIIVKEKGYKQEYSGNNKRYIKEFGEFDYTDFKQAISDLYQWYSNPKNVNLNQVDLL